MKADTLFAELCPDMTVAEYCLAPPSEGVCCGCALLSPRPSRPPELTPPPRPAAGSARTQASAGSAATSHSPSRPCHPVRPRLPLRGPARGAARPSSSSHSRSHRHRAFIRTILAPLEPDPGQRLCRVAAGLPALGLERPRCVPLLHLVPFALTSARTDALPSPQTSSTPHMRCCLPSRASYLSPQ